MDLYEYALLSSFDITKRPHSEVRVFLRDSLVYPVFEKDEKGDVLCFAKPKKLKSGKVSFLGWLFDSDNEIHRALLWRLFKASIYHLSSHVVVTDFAAYADWARDKDLDLATFAVCLIEDAVIRAYLKSHFAMHMLDNAFANTVSYLSMKSSQVVYNHAVRVMASLLSNFAVGLSKGGLSEEKEKQVHASILKLKNLESNAYNEFLNKTQMQGGSGSPSLKDVVLDERIEVADSIYNVLDSLGEDASDVPSLPYTESHGRNLLFRRGSVPIQDEVQMEHVLKKALKTLDVQAMPDEQIHDELTGKSIQSEVSQILSSWESKEALQLKILDAFKALGKGTHFKSFGFPDEDYVEFVRRRNQLGSTVRRILEKLRLFRNIGGEDYRHEVGLLDLQEAIQVVASKSPRTDVFVRDELQTMDEMWSILIDASYSLSFFKGDVQGVALCMAEVARKLMVNQNSWSMYAFNNRFYVVKDFSEPYSNHTRARIGGLRQSGMTYLPDGLLLAGEALRRKGGELKVLVVVSDFFPSGYGDVEKALVDAAKKVEKSGIGVIGIGMNSGTVKKYFRTHCVVETPEDLMKKFTKAFFEISSTV